MASPFGNDLRFPVTFRMNMFSDSMVLVVKVTRLIPEILCSFMKNSPSTFLLYIN